MKYKKSAARKNKTKRNKNFSDANVGFFSSVLHRAGISQQVQASIALETVRKIFEERFGEGVTLHAKPTQMRKKTLVVEVAHPAVSQQIRQQEEVLLQEIKRRTQRELLRIQCVLPQEGREIQPE